MHPNRNEEQVTNNSVLEQFALPDIQSAVRINSNKTK